MKEKTEEIHMEMAHGIDLREWTETERKLRRRIGSVWVFLKLCNSPTEWTWAIVLSHANKPLEDFVLKRDYAPSLGVAHESALEWLRVFSAELAAGLKEV